MKDSKPSAGTKNPTKKLRVPKSEKVRAAKDAPNAAKKALKTQAENTVNHGNSGGESCN